MAGCEDHRETDGLEEAPISREVLDIFSHAPLGDVYRRKADTLASLVYILGVLDGSQSEPCFLGIDIHRAVELRSTLGEPKSVIKPGKVSRISVGDVDSSGDQIAASPLELAASVGVLHQLPCCLGCITGRQGQA